MIKPLAAFLLVASVAPAQESEPPTIGVLGRVENGRVAWKEGMTIFDVVIDAKPRREASWTAITLLRTTGLEVLTIEINVREMMTTGNTAANVMIKKGDLVVVPTKEQVSAAKEKGEAAQALLAAIDDSTLSATERARILGWRLETGKNVTQRQQIVSELGKLGRDAADAVPQLVRALDADLVVAREAATTLGMIGAPAKLALPAIGKLLEHADKALRERARAADKQIRAAVAVAEAPLPPRAK